MSTLLDQARTRVPRFAEAAVERARLTVVPRPRTAAGRAGRVPFVTLVSLLLVAGVAGLLFFNTSMQQTAFTATALEAKASVLQAQKQSLQMQLDTLRDPQRVALQAKHLGMVRPASPAFITLGTGRVPGDPQPAVVDAKAFRLTPYPSKKPKRLAPPPIEVPATVLGAAAVAGTTAPGTKSTQHGTTSTTGGSER
jgi:cell division protein FtsL